MRWNHKATTFFLPGSVPKSFVHVLPWTLVIPLGDNVMIIPVLLTGKLLFEEIQLPACRHFTVGNKSQQKTPEGLTCGLLSSTRYTEG